MRVATPKPNILRPPPARAPTAPGHRHRTRAPLRSSARPAAPPPGHCPTRPSCCGLWRHVEPGGFGQLHSYLQRYNEGAMKLEIELEVPDGAVDKGAEAELIRSVKEQAALKLYSDERVTTGEAAEMLDLTRIQFLDLLRRTDVGFRVELDDEDFAQIRRLRDEHVRQNNRCVQSSPTVAR